MANSIQDPKPLINDVALKIANLAYQYGLPLILVDITKQQSISKEAIINQFSNMSQFLNASDEYIVRPNCDTYYSTAFFDLSGGPLIIDIPITDSQYYMMPILDAFTNVLMKSDTSVGSPGTRTGQTQGGQYLLVRDTYIVSELQKMTYQIIKCPTDMAWAIGRFQVNNPNSEDFDVDGGGYVINLQNQLSINPYQVNTPLSDSSYDYGTDSPNKIIANMSISDFFNRLNTLLINNPPTLADEPAIHLFKTIGVGSGMIFDISKFDEDTQEAMNALPQSITQELGGKSSTLTSTKWSINLNSKMGDFGTDYPLRAAIAYNGLGANLVADAAYYGTYCYGSDTNNLLSCSDGQKYQLFLDPIPPQNAFWSITMYNQNGYFIDNPISRYGVGHNAQYTLNLINNGDGTQSTTIYIQNDPISDKDTNFPNWLPAPADGNFNVMIRVYWPDPSVVDENKPSWIPPAVELVS